MLTMDDKQYYSVPEIAKMLDLTSAMILTDIKRGNLVPEEFRIGKNYLISRDNLGNYLRYKLTVRRKRRTERKNGKKP